MFVIQNRIAIGAFCGSMLLAGAVVASPVPMGYQASGIVDRGALVVQNAALDAVSPSALRRLTFYSDMAILALFDLANEDLAAGENGATISNDTTNALRSAIERLIDAGDKADLSVENVAIFFAQEVEVRFSGPIPFILQGLDGEIDAQSLFRGIADSKAVAAAPRVDANYLSALTAESANMATTESSNGVVAAPVAEEAAPTDENRDPAIVAILDRVKMVDGNRTIEVVQGDTLAAYALAFYGDTLLYRSIFLANTEVLSNPNLLEVGQIVTIPEN